LQRKSKHMAKERIQINPQTIINAITRAGFKEDEFLDKHDDVRAWIEGEKDPTPKQLEKFAEQVYLPFGYLFMDKFPTEKSPIPFFRTVSASHHFNLNIYDAIMSLQQWEQGDGYLFHRKTKSVIINRNRGTGTCFTEKLSQQ